MERRGKVGQDKPLNLFGYGRPPGPTMISLAFLPLACLVFRLDQWNDQRNVLRLFRRDRLRGSAHVLWMMVAIGALHHFGRHAEIAGSLPDRYATLHQPGRRRVTQRVRCYFAPQTSKFDHVLEAGFDRFDRRPLPFHKVGSDDAAPSPASHMGYEPRRYRRGRLPLVGCAAADGQSVEDALVQIDERVTISAIRRRRSDRAGPRAGVEANQNKSGEMPERPLAGCYQLSPMTAAMNGLTFTIAPACPDQLCGLAAREPTISWWPFGRQCDSDDAVM
jgi:hypothetical protein